MPRAYKRANPSLSVIVLRDRFTHLQAANHLVLDLRDSFEPMRLPYTETFDAVFEILRSSGNWREVDPTFVNYWIGAAVYYTISVWNVPQRHTPPTDINPCFVNYLISRNCLLYGFDIIGYSLRTAASKPRFIKTNRYISKLSYKRRTTVFYIIIDASNPGRETKCHVSTENLFSTLTVSAFILTSGFFLASAFDLVPSFPLGSAFALRKSDAWQREVIIHLIT